ncbi:MAG TPA: cellulase family glycosylhydrolase [Candidatus Dormibacteraeota bacterium]|nr:cellulase family glycosylhydrolase [Candidatus Dormibacteraeota bacterium]
MFHSRRRGRRPRRRGGQRAGGFPAGLALLLMLVAGLGWAYAPVPPLSVSLPDPARPAGGALPWLHVENAAHIVDESGRAVLLRGFNDSALLERDSVNPAPLTERDAQVMQQSGFTVVRLPVAWSRLEPERGHIDGTYLDEVQRDVAMLEAHGLYVVIDMHFVDWGPQFGGTGAPRWATIAGVPDAQWWPWESWRRHLSPAVNAAYSYFWLAPDWQRDYQMAWQAVAQRFRDDSGIAGWDLFNEPHPVPIPPRLFENNWMWPLYARTIAAIGSVDPNHLFFVEGDLFGDFPTTIVPLQARDVVYSPHIYTGSLVPPAFTGDRAPFVSHVVEQEGEARQVPAPMWTGELGIDHQQPHAYAYADTALDTYDDNQTGWAWWQWRQDRNWGVETRGGAVDMAWLHHLARPFVAMAPDGVSGGRGDGVKGHLVVHVAPLHADQPVLVSWPGFTLGAPVVSGDCVEASPWDPDTARVTLTLLPGAGCDVVLRAA